MRFVFIILLLFFSGCFPSLQKFETQYQKLIAFYERRLNRVSQEKKIEFAQFLYNFRDYEKVVELLKNEGGKEAKILLAKSLTHLGKYTLALEIFEKISEELDSGEGFYLYGIALEKKNLYPKALKIYQKVKPPYYELAQKRIRKIKAKVEKLHLPYIHKLLEEAKGFLRKIKDEAGLILFVDERMEITSHNTSLWEIHVIEKILNERGKKMAEIEIGYDSTYERIELEFARSINKEGNVFYAGEENIRDVSKYLNYPLYSNARAFIISLPGAEVGSIIEYKLRIYSSRLINKDDFSIFYRLREEYPIYKAQFRVIIPLQKKIRFKFFNEEYARGINLYPQESQYEDKKVYTWKFKEILPLYPESRRPSSSYINPTIAVTSFDSWEEIYKWWYDLYKDKLFLGKEEKKFLRKYLGGIKDPYTKAKRLYEYVAKNIRYVAVEYGESGYQPHQASTVFLNKYGDCKDQTILLVALLREAGVESFPVLISTQDNYLLDKNFPALYFNHVICAIRLNDKIVFCDPTSETTSFSDLPVMDQARGVLLFLDEKGFKILKTPQLRNSRILYNMEIEVKKGSVLIKRKITSFGNYASYQRWYLKYTHPKKIKEKILEKMREFSSFSRFLKYRITNIDDLDKSPCLEYSFVAEKFLNPAKNLRILPAFNEIGLDYSLIAKEERIYPIDFKGIFTKEAEIVIKLPSNLKLKYLPSSAKIETEWFSFFSNYSFKKKEDAIRLRQSFTIKKRFVFPQEYREFSSHLKEVFYLLRHNIILEKVDDEEEEEEKF